MSALIGSDTVLQDGPVNEDDFSTIRNRTRSGSDTFSDGEAPDTDTHGDYASRMDEILSESNDSDRQDGPEEEVEEEVEEEEEEGFLYTGKDVEESSGGYREQLKDVLDDELDSEEDVYSRGFDLGESLRNADESYDTLGQLHVVETLASDHSASTSSNPPSSASPVRMISPYPEDVPRPFLHPSISRLRSSLPVQRQDIKYSSSIGTVHLASRKSLSPSPSHFSSISRTSSISNLRAAYSSASKDGSELEAFRWTNLRIIGGHVFNKTSEKANALLGSPDLGLPTVLTANGLICVGTDTGRAFIFDFKQQLKCICGDETSVRSFGPVTALALSHDHTYVAVGHIHGHIQLFDISHPNVAARSVNPSTLAAVGSGRQEGHILGSRIVALGFISGRHTAFVSADDQGLAFFHSLGKVLFMEANDCLRILGKYPEEELMLPAIPAKYTQSSNGANPSADGTVTPYPTSQPGISYGPVTLGDCGASYRIVPAHCDVNSYKARYSGFEADSKDVQREVEMARMPCMVPSVSTSDSASEDRPKKGKKGQDNENQDVSFPLLAYSWGCTLNILRASESRVSQKVRNEKTGKVEKVQLILFTDSTLEVLDIRTLKIVEKVFYDSLNLISPTLGYTLSGVIAYQDSIRDIQHSVRTYKGKIFVLEHKEVKVGTLLSWADRILSFAKGNKNGLPENIDVMRTVVGEKMSELMVASARYAFSEDRLTDSTHVTADNRGVDRTALFEDLVSTCARGCIALDDFDFLFEDLFQYYDGAGIARIYLRQLEPFVLDSSIHFIPPQITQRLVAMHDEDGRQEAAERIIWHIDPDCLDINQALTLCQKYHLYDALIYVYNTALRDYITPVVELLGLVRKVQQNRKERSLKSKDPDSPVAEHLVLNAYKIYPYLSNILSGLAYPSESPLSSEDALKAQNDVYSFLFYGRSSVWPVGEGGRLVLTADEEGGPEPTYPYARLLLRFDAEAFLHILDIAFEHLNDETHGTSRQIIVKILLDIVATSGSTLTSYDVTFVNIFVARNVPKYPQFIHIAPSSLQNLLVGLASDTDQSTREDRQLATEFLLSAYTPHDSDRILRLFEEAQFYRILRSWYRQEGQWASLLRTYLHDPETNSRDIFPSIEMTLAQASRDSKNGLPEEVLAAFLDSIHLLLQSSIPQTAFLVDKYSPNAHSKVINIFDEDAVHKHYAYLRCLLGPPSSSEDSQSSSTQCGSSTSVEPYLRKLYLNLLCQLEPASTIAGIKYLPREALDVNEVVDVCEEAKVYDAVVWLLNQNSAVASLSKFESFSHELTAELGEELLKSEEADAEPSGLYSLMTKFEALCRMGIRICREHSQQIAEADVPLEDLWFKLLSSQIDAVQVISMNEHVIASLRSLVQDSFTSLVTVSSTKAVSFPRLFKRLVDSTFRTILTSMLESYRSEGDLLMMSKRIIDTDFFDALNELAKTRMRGWAAQSAKCPRYSLIAKDMSPSKNSLVVSRFGIYHSICFSSNLIPA
ncbi:lateendosome to vacuole transport-family protein [Phellopilus nigrolimitatus]|nr:lateendosome to vacuole transport-family protein [Phellopilus nigrolimitatus]